MIEAFPIELLVAIARAATLHDEYVFNSLARVIPRLGKWAAQAGNRAAMMKMFGHEVFNRRLYDGMMVVEWQKHGVRHRNDGPAYVAHPTHAIWYKMGIKHRIGGPAISTNDGREEWWQNGQLHREDGPAYIEPSGIQIWYIRGQLHRLDGPAVMFSDKSEVWYLHNLKHRIGGPAVRSTTGRGTACEWWVDGHRVG